MRWTPDALFYQAQVYEVEGEAQATAIRTVFSGAAAVAVERVDHRLVDPLWLKYSAPFYRRRWLVPAIAAALSPIVGQRALLHVSFLGYVGVGPLLFLLLRRRFPDAVSVGVAAACLLLPPVRTWSEYPLTDSWGLALEIGSLIAALLALERGGGWIAVWTMSMLALSFTRDATVILLVAVACVSIAIRTRHSWVVLATGVAASIPAPLLFGAPLVHQLAWALRDFYIPRHPTLWYVVSHYPAGLLSVIRKDLLYPYHLGLDYVWYLVGVLMLAATAYTVRASSRRDPFFALYRGALVGAAVSVALAVSYTYMRLELAFIPCVAVALAFSTQSVVDVRSVNARRSAVGAGTVRVNQ